MKLTKKSKKKMLGMNSATKKALNMGHKTPTYIQKPSVNGIPSNYYIKAASGVPYVNPENFN